MVEAPLRRRVQLGLELDRGPDEGLRVSAVLPDSAAALARIMPGDLLLEIAGKTVRTADDLFAIVRGVDAGNVVSFTVERGGARRMLEGRAGALALERLAVGRIVLDEIPTP